MAALARASLAGSRSVDLDGIPEEASPPSLRDSLHSSPVASPPKKSMSLTNVISATSVPVNVGGGLCLSPPPDGARCHPAAENERLRMALLHAIQRERGVTCGWVASCGAEEPWGLLLPDLRRVTDSMLKASDIASTLRRIRTEANTSVSRAEDNYMYSWQTPQTGPSEDFYRCFRDFNELNRTILKRPAAQVVCDRSEAELVNTTVEVAVGSEAFRAFTAMKEWHGVERAFLCGVLALPEDALPELPKRAFADLVTGMNQQKAQEQLVRDAAPPKLLDLIRAGFEYSPALREVQEALLENFDVVRLRGWLSAERAWQLMTEQIDKLDQLQALLADDMARSDGAHADAGAAVAVKQAAAALVDRGGRGGGVAATAAAMERVSALPAEQFKAATLRALAARLKELGSAPPPGRPGEKEFSPTDRGGAVIPTSGDESDSFRRRRATWDVVGDEVPEAFRISVDELTFIQRLGDGAAGVTYLASWAGTRVAVKVAAAKGLGSWRNEAAAMAGLRHANIVRCFGVVVTPPTFGLVLEYCERRDLSEALRGATPPGFVLDVSGGITAGMAYLHGRGVMHRDLKSANVLIDASGAAKVTDFGLAAQAPDDTARGGSLTAETGTYRWMAPEVIRHEPYSKSADVFSFGMILFELLTHQLPFADQPALQAAVAVALAAARPPLPDRCPPALARLVSLCWASESSERPSFTYVADALVTIRAELAPAEMQWLDDSGGHPVYEKDGAFKASGDDAFRQLRVTSRGRSEEQLLQLLHKAGEAEMG
jgi:mitogen-activated protein kinase kinase kinase 11